MYQNMMSAWEEATAPGLLKKGVEVYCIEQTVWKATEARVKEEAA